MRVIGFFGGIGSGKSTVLDILKEKYAAIIIKADELGHLAMKKDSSTYMQMVENFGTGILNDDLTIDRKKLAAVLLADGKKLEVQNSIVHPFVKAEIGRIIAEGRKNGAGIIALESAILYESGCNEFCDETWLISAPLHVRVERLMRSRGYTREKAYAFINKQKSDPELRKLCDVEIVNDGSIENIYKQLEKYIEQTG